MNVLIAPCSFKGSLSAQNAAEAIRLNLERVSPRWVLHTQPLADGGEGTLQVLSDLFEGKIHHMTCDGPYGQPVEAQWAELCTPEQEKVALIESAQVLGLHLAPKPYKPLMSTSRGLGQLILAALDAGFQHIWIGLGGTATIDGGMGMLASLGMRFFDRQGKQLKASAAGLKKLHRLEADSLDPRLRNCELTVLCDVLSPLLGEAGAMLYMPQKGAKGKVASELNLGLKRLAEVAEAQLQLQVAHLPGAGAAGGLGAGLAMLGGWLIRGSQFVIEQAQIEDLLGTCDVVITGEGRLDEQTIEGKTVATLAMAAKRHNIPLICLCGEKNAALEDLRNLGLTAAFSLVPGPVTRQEAMAAAEHHLGQIAYDIANLLKFLK